MVNNTQNKVRDEAIAPAPLTPVSSPAKSIAKGVAKGYRRITKNLYTPPEEFAYAAHFF